MKDLRLRENGFLSFFPSKKFRKDTKKIFYNSVLIALLGTFNIFVDNFIAGNLGKDAVIGIGITSFAMGFLQLIAGGVSMAFTGILAQSLNTKRFGDAQKAWDLIMFLTIILGLVVGIIFYFFGSFILEVQITNNPNAVALGKKYMQWEIFSIFISIINIQYNQLFAAIGKTKMTLIVTGVAISINIFVSLILTYGLHMGVVGTAVGTLISVLIALLIKIWYSWKDKDLNIKIMPYRMVYISHKSWKYIKKSWWYIPYEAIWFFFNYALITTFTRGFDGGDLAYSIGSPFWYTFSGAVGAIPILSKYLGTLLGKGEEKKAQEYAKIISLMSFIRMIPIAVALMGLALLVPYLHIYDIPRDQLWPGQVFLFYCSLTSVIGVLYMLGYVIFSLGGKPKKGMLLDILNKLLLLSILLIASFLTKNIMWGLFWLVIPSLCTDVIMIFIALHRSNYNSLYQKKNNKMVFK